MNSLDSKIEMEVILENLSMDATAGKLKAITDACDEGLGKWVVRFGRLNLLLLTLLCLFYLEALSKERIGRAVEAYELR